MSGDPARTGLPDRVAWLERRVRTLVAHRRGDDPAPDDPFRGLYVSEEMVDLLLAGRPPDPGPGPGPEQPGAGSRLATLADRAGLLPLDLHILVAALAPDLDTRFEPLYGYLNDDVGRRRASFGLALELAGVPVAAAAARARMLPGAPLVDHRLLLVEEPHRPVLSRPLRVPDRVGGHLLGDDAPDPELLPVLAEATAHHSAGSAALSRALAGGVRLAYLRDGGRRSAAATAAAAAASAGLGVLALDLRRLADAERAAELVAAAGREALLCAAAVVAGPVDDLAARAPAALRELARLAVPVLLTGDAGWDPLWSRQVPLLLDAPEIGTAERLRIWHSALAGPDLPGGTGPPGGTAAGRSPIGPEQVPVHLPLGPEQIRRAVRAARLGAGPATGPVDGHRLRAGARQQNAAGLERLTRRLEPDVGWQDLVLPEPVAGALRELADRARHRGRVLTDWRMRPGGGRGRGVTALFAGDSGTGKTMSAEVIAADLGLDLYTVNLATVIDKYVGETEKNLERIFVEAGGVNGVLLFDEADAVFGRRSEVRDAHDRYANVESAYLLQRMETFDGLAVLATNLRANIDEAFTRRLDAVVDFPTPDATLRRALWDRCLGRHVPRGTDLDLDFCAGAFELSGGAIRSVAVTAAYLAAASGGPVGMAELIGAVQREYRKLGRLLLPHEFGPYFPLVRAGNPG